MQTARFHSSRYKYLSSRDLPLLVSSIGMFWKLGRRILDRWRTRKYMRRTRKKIRVRVESSGFVAMVSMVLGIED